MINLWSCIKPAPDHGSLKGYLSVYFYFKVMCVQHILHSEEHSERF
jgi:hypothetical protein